MEVRSVVSLKSVGRSSGEAVGEIVLGARDVEDANVDSSFSKQVEGVGDEGAEGKEGCVIGGSSVEGVDSSSRVGADENAAEGRKAGSKDLDNGRGDGEGLSELDLLVAGGWS